MRRNERKTDSEEFCDWLVYEETSQTMFSSVCYQHSSDANKRTNSFNVGAKSLKLEATKDHKLSKGLNQSEDGPVGEDEPAV